MQPTSSTVDLVSQSNYLCESISLLANDRFGALMLCYVDVKFYCILNAVT